MFRTVSRTMMISTSTVATSRAHSIASHLRPPPPSAAKAALLSKKEDTDVVVIGAVRTPLTKGGKGSLKDTLPEDLLVAVFKGLIEKTGVDPNKVEEIVVGTVLQPSGGANQARIAQLAAGFPISSYVSTVNRQCSSGLLAVTSIAKSIRAGEIEIGIGAGVESMSKHFGPQSLPTEHSEELLKNPNAADCLVPMGITSENVTAKYHLTREEQDTFAAASFAKAEKAQKAGNFVSEIIPVRTKVIDKEGKVTQVVVDRDDGIRPGTTKEVLAKLRPAFKENGLTTAGTSSQVTDGAAAVLLTSRAVANRLNLPIIGRFLGAATAGVPPALMGVGPAYAIPKLLKPIGLETSDIDFFEINEAFASQALLSQRELNIPDSKLNPNGGGISFGHPLGATGARQLATGFAEAGRREGEQLFVSSMCIGSGMGMAALWASEGK